MKVMRLLKARQTLRTLRFVAEMKVYLREDHEKHQRANLKGGILSPRKRPPPPEKDAFEIEQERREINSVFELFDSDSSGSISIDEMRYLLEGISPEITDAQVDRIMERLDAHNTQEVTFDMFYEWCTSQINESELTSDELIEEVFKMVDTDNSGEITVDEFIEIFKKLGQSLDHDDVRELVYQMDRDNNGTIDVEEFSKMLKKHAM